MVWAVCQGVFLPLDKLFLLNRDGGGLGVLARANLNDTGLIGTFADGVEVHGGVLVFDLIQQGDQFSDGHVILHSPYFLSLGGFPS